MPSPAASSLPTASPSPSPLDPDAPRVISFAGRAGSAPDPAVWNHETGGHGWGHDELQTYTDSTENSFVDGSGNLVVRALRQTKRGADGVTRRFTSARITTAEKIVIEPGSYVSASLRVPVGPGVWPAFWLIGTNFREVGWPASGELDILEGNAPRPELAHSAIHLPSASNSRVDKPFGFGWPGGTVDVGEPLDADFHEYGVYFGTDAVRFFIDRKPTMAVTAAEARKLGRSWPFGQPQYLILNVAIDETGQAAKASFPQDLVVRNLTIWPAGIPFSVN